MTYVNKGSTTAIGIIFPVILLALSAARVRQISLAIRQRNLALYDVLLVPAVIITVGLFIGLVVGSQMGFVGGHNGPEIDRVRFEQLGKLQYAFWLGDTLAAGLTKLSILFFFRRIFRGQSRTTPFDYVNWTLIVCDIIYTLVFSFLIGFWCGTEPSLSWTGFDALGKCLDTDAILEAHGVCSMVMDLAIFILPLCMIYSLNMSRRDKIQACVAFLFSALAVIAGLLRMIIMIQIKLQGITPPTTVLLGETFPYYDGLGVVSTALFWGYIEIGVGCSVALLLTSAKTLNKFVYGPIAHQISSLTSLISTRFRDSSGRSTGARAEGWQSDGSLQSSEAWQMAHRKRSSSVRTSSAA